MLILARRTVALCAVALAAASPLAAQVADPDPARFAEVIARFAAWDRQNSFPERAVLFVGSSSIAGWPTADRFPGLPVINRGIGGAQISDSNHFLEETVLKYSPDVIVLYAGNNDVEAGKTPQQVLEDYQQFVAAVHARKSDTRIVYVSIHPSLARWARWPKMHEANELIRAWSAGNPRLRYADISQAMLGSDGRPMPQLFVQDGLHLTPAGYDIWTPIVARVIESVRR